MRSKDGVEVGIVGVKEVRGCEVTDMMIVMDKVKLGA